MITQRLKIDGQNIVKDDGSLFPAWGHNYDNLNILDARVYGEIIENVWGNHLYAKNGVFTITNVAWSYITDSPPFTYNVTLTLAEPLSADTFTDIDKITIAGTSLTGVYAYGPNAGTSINFNIDGASTDSNINRTAVSIDTSANTITFQQKFTNFINNGSMTVTNGIVGTGSIELDLAILKNIAKSRIIRIALQMDKFLFSDADYSDAVNSQFDPTNSDTYTINQNQLNNLIAFLDLAAKYDIYVIINGANTWVASNQPNWLSSSTEGVRWAAQAGFWKNIASAIYSHPAVAWYSLINEPVDQYNDYQIISHTLDDLGNINTITAIDSRGAVFRSDKSNTYGYAYITNADNSKIELVQYRNITSTQSSSTTITASNISRSAPILDDLEINGSWFSLIDKAPDILDLTVQTNENNVFANIDTYANVQPFQLVTNDSYLPVIGFVGDSTTVGTGLTVQSNKFSTQLISQLTSKGFNETEYNYGILGTALSSPNGYGQVFQNYPNGNQYKINCINFGINDFILYGTPNGYNSKYFIQTLRVILSRLRSSSVTEFTGLSGFSTITNINASGGSYQKTTSNKQVTFSTPSGFSGGTVAVGFMVEDGASAQATITVNGRSYPQSLTSGGDTLSGVTLPVIKRIHNVPAGSNTFTINLTVNSGSACLDYWQIEDPSPGKIIVSSIYKFASYPNIDNWNKEIQNLIFGEFFDSFNFGTQTDGTPIWYPQVVYLDVNAVLLPSDFDGTNTYPNLSGHTKLATAYYDTTNNNKFLPIVNVSGSGQSYTFICSTPHNFGINDSVYISGVVSTPADALNGYFVVTNVTSPTSFTITGKVANAGLTNSSLANATFSKQTLKPNTTYSIISETIPFESNVSFTTGSSISTTNGIYSITLSNSNNVQTSSEYISATITNNTQWAGPSYGNLDRHYVPYITLTPRGRLNTQIAKEWISKMVSAIREVDQYTYITIPTTFFYGNELSPDAGGFGPANITSITVNNKPAIDILSPHQYPNSQYNTLNTSVSNLVNNLSILSSYNKPVVLEEGARPDDKYSVRRASQYLLQSKRYLAGALNSYQGYYKFVFDGATAWYPWTSDKYYYQYVYNMLAPFLNDAVIDDPNKTSIIHSNYDGPIGQEDQDVNKPQITGRRYLAPASDLSSSGFSFNSSGDYFAPSNYTGITVDGSYVAQTELVKNPLSLPQSTTTWFSGTGLGSIYMKLNGFYQSSNQKILNIKPIVNLRRGNIMILKSQGTAVGGNSVNSGWSMYPSTGYTFDSVVNISRSTTLTNSITNTASTIALSNAASAGLSSTGGVVLIDQEYIKYSSLSANTLTVATNGRGYYNTIAANHNSGAVVKNTVSDAANYGVKTNNNTSNIDWKINPISNALFNQSPSNITVWIYAKVDSAINDSNPLDSGTAYNLRTLNFTTTSTPTGSAPWLKGASLYTSGTSYIATDTFISSTSTSHSVVMNQYPISSIPSGTNIYATTQQSMAVTLTNYAGDVLYDSNVTAYKGYYDTSGTTIYSYGDQVYYNGSIWYSVYGGHRNRVPSTSSTYWTKSYDTIGDDVTQFAWLKFTFTQVNNYWTDSFGNAIVNFNPNEIKISAYNSNGISLSSKYIYISKIYADIYLNGNTDSIGSTVLQGNVSKSNLSGSSLPDTTFSFKNGLALSEFNNKYTVGSTGTYHFGNRTLSDIYNVAWLTPDNSTGQIVNQSGGIIIDQTVIDAPMLLQFNVNINTPGHDKSYLLSTVNNLDINTGYVEVQIQETLSRKGNPIVSMG